MTGKLISAREEHILLAVIALGDEATSGAIADRLAQAYGHTISYPAVLSELQTMTQNGLLATKAIKTTVHCDTVTDAYYSACSGALQALASRSAEREKAEEVRGKILGGEQW